MIQTGVDDLYASQLIEASVDGIFLLDDDCKVLAWNTKMQSITSLSIDQVRGKPIFNVIKQSKEIYFIEALKLTLNNKGSILHKHLYFSEVSISDFYEASISPFQLPFGEGIGCMVVLRRIEDVSPERRFKSLVEESPIATAIFDVSGEAKYFNKACGEIWDVEWEILESVVHNYNILKDKQLRELGVLPFIERAFNGDISEMPPVLFNPQNSPALSQHNIDQPRYVKGQLFPLVIDGDKIEEVVLVLNDITLQKQAEETLFETNLKFERVTQGLPGVIYEYEEEGEKPHTFRYISEGYRELYGIDSNDTVNDASLFEALIHPDDVLSYERSIRKSRRNDSRWFWSGRIVIDSEIKWIEGKSTAVRLNDNTLVRHGLLLDITDKKRVEDKYKLLEEQLQIALSGADLGLWEWDLIKGKVLLNPSWSKKLGYEFNEFNELFNDRVSLIHPDDLEEFLAKTRQSIKGLTSIVEVEYRMLTKNGNWIWVLDRGSVLERDESGKVIKASGTLLDIQASKTTQQLIKQNELLFTQLFENSPMGVVLLDDEHKVVQMNQGFENLFGFSKEEIIGNRLNKIIVPSENLKEAIDINELTSKGSVGTLESKRLNKNGELIPVIIYGVPVSFDQKTLGIYGIYVDISQRVKIESELQIRNEELDNFVYKVSHDLRAPLSSILGLTNLASLEHNEDDLKEYIRLIDNRVKQLDTFINDVLSHSKNLKLEVEIDEIDFNEIIENSYNELNYLPNAELIIRKVAINGSSFKSDVWRIKELFRNLISNAIKYADVEKDCSYITIDIDVSDEQANIQVEDNGIGIEESAKPQIFDMFYRATTTAEGSGIGLYIVKNAIDKLGGKVSISSTIGEGTCFNIILPNNL